MPRLPLAILAAAVTLAASPIHAQLLTQDDLRAGMRVRVSAPQIERETATVLGYRGDTLLLLAGGADTLPLALASVSEVAVSVGTKRDRGRGSLLGLGIGALVGGGLGTVAAFSDRDTGLRSFATVSGMAAGAGLGLVTGAILGAGRTDDWRRVGPGRGPVGARVAPRVDRSGVGVAVSMRLGQR